MSMALDTFTESLYSLYIASVQWEVSMLPTSYVWADLMAQATASQLLAYLKLCGVEQATIARTFGVSPTAVSMWVRGHRPMPLRYGPVLARLLQQTAREAAHRVQQAVRRHNTPVRQQIEQDASEAPFVRWAEDVLRTRQTQEERLRRLLEQRSEEHTSELQSLRHLVCRLLLEKKKKKKKNNLNIQKKKKYKNK